MSEYTPPPGRTFKERWPDEVAETAWLAGPWIPLVVGGLAGMLTLPVTLAMVLDPWFPWSLIVLLGLVAVATAGVLRTRGRPQRLVGRIWRVLTWAVLATVLGYAIAFVGMAICEPGICRVGTGPSRSSLLVAGTAGFAASILGSMAIAWWVDRTGKRLVARTRATDGVGMR